MSQDSKQVVLDRIRSLRNFYREENQKDQKIKLHDVSNVLSPAETRNEINLFTPVDLSLQKINTQPKTADISIPDLEPLLTYKEQTSGNKLKNVLDIAEPETIKEKPDPFAMFRTVTLPDGKHLLPDKTKSSRLTNLATDKYDPEATKLFEEQKAKEKPQGYRELKGFQNELDDIEYLNKKYSNNGAEYDADDERKLKNLINIRNTQVGIHNNLTFGELEDYKLFNAAKKIRELKGRSDFQKDLKNVPEHIYSGILNAVNSVTGADYDTSTKSNIRKDTTNQNIEQEFKKETQPHTLFGQIVQGLTTTAALAPLFAFSFEAGGVNAAKTFGGKLLSAFKGSVPTFAPGGISRGLQKSVKEVSDLEDKGEQVDVFDRALIFLKNTGGESFKSIMEPLSEVVLPGLKPGKTLLSNILKKSSLGILTETGTEQITDITGDLVDGTNTSLLVSLANTGKLSEESINQFLVEAIIAGVYGSTVGGGEFWSGHLKQKLSPEEFNYLLKYVDQNKTQLQKNLGEVFTKAQADIDQIVRDSLKPGNKPVKKDYYKQIETLPKAAPPTKPIVQGSTVPIVEEKIDKLSGEPISQEYPSRISTKDISILNIDPIADEKTQQRLNRIQEKQKRKDDTDTYSEISRQFKNARRNRNLIDEEELLKLTQRITTPEVKQKTDELIKEAQNSNKRITKNSEFTLENLSKRKFGSMDLNSLTNDQQQEIINEYNDLKKQGIDNFRKPDVIIPKIKEREITNAIKESLGEDSPSQPEPVTTKNTNREKKNEEENIETENLSEEKELSATEALKIHFADLGSEFKGKNDKGDYVFINKRTGRELTINPQNATEEGIQSLLQDDENQFLQEKEERQTASKPQIEQTNQSLPKKTDSENLPVTRQSEQVEIPSVDNVTTIAPEVKNVPVSSIQTDENRFQNRALSYAPRTVKSIVESYSPAKFDPVVVWIDPSSKETFVLSGHSRLEGMKRRKADQIPVRYFEGTEQEAIEFARLEANRSASKEDLLEDIKAYNFAKEKNYSKKQLEELFPNGQYKALEDLSRLNSNGQFLINLNSENRSSFPYLERNARWVGQLKQNYPELTGTHEDEMFDFFYREKDKNLRTKKEDFILAVEKQINRADFTPDQALMLDAAGKTTGLRARADTADLQKEIDELVERKKEAITDKEIEALDNRIAKLKERIQNIVSAQLSFLESTKKYDAEKKPVNAIWYNEIDKLKPFEWDEYAKIRRRQGYDVKDGQDAKRILEDRIKRTQRPITNEDVLEAYNKAVGKFQKTEKPSENNNKLFSAAKQVFGITSNYKEAGYILPDGSMLDFSGKREGGDPGMRVYDHREITRLYEKNTSTDMHDFISNGAVRFMPESNGFYFKKPLTNNQKRIAKEIVEDNDGYVIVEVGEGLDTLYREYDKGTSVNTIFRDIDKHFRNNSKSKIDEFKNSTGLYGGGEELLESRRKYGVEKVFAKEYVKEQLELFQHGDFGLDQDKLDEIKTLLERDIPFGEVSIRSGIPLEIVEEIAGSDLTLADINRQIKGKVKARIALRKANEKDKVSTNTRSVNRQEVRKELSIPANQPTEEELDEKDREYRWSLTSLAITNRHYYPNPLEKTMGRYAFGYDLSILDKNLVKNNYQNIDLSAMKEARENVSLQFKEAPEFYGRESASELVKLRDYKKHLELSIPELEKNWFKFHDLDFNPKDSDFRQLNLIDYSRTKAVKDLRDRYEYYGDAPAMRLIDAKLELYKTNQMIQRFRKVEKKAAELKGQQDIFSTPEELFNPEPVEKLKPVEIKKDQLKLFEDKSNFRRDIYERADIFGNKDEQKKTKERVQRELQSGKITERGGEEGGLSTDRPIRTIQPDYAKASSVKFNAEYEKDITIPKRTIPEETRQILKQWRENGYINYADIQLGGNFIQDIADMYKVARDPFVETFWAIGRDINNKIVVNIALSSNASNYVYLGKDNFEKIANTLVERGAVKVTILHNHPSGNPKPSEQDIYLSRIMRDYMKLHGLRLDSSVVINGDKYAAWMVTDEVEIYPSLYEYKSPKTHPLEEFYTKFDSFPKLKVSSDTGPMYFAQLKYGNGNVALIVLDNELKVRGYEYLHKEYLKDSEKFGDYADELMRSHGGARVIIVGEMGDIPLGELLPIPSDPDMFNAKEKKKIYSEYSHSPIAATVIYKGKGAIQVYEYEDIHKGKEAEIVFAEKKEKYGAGKQNNKEDMYELFPAAENEALEIKTEKIDFPQSPAYYYDLIKSLSSTNLGNETKKELLEPIVKSQQKEIQYGVFKPAHRGKELNPLVRGTQQLIFDLGEQTKKEFNDFQNKNTELIRKARHSVKRSIRDIIIPDDREVIEYLEGKMDSARLTKEQKELADWTQKFFISAIPVMTNKNARDHYVTHIKRGFLEIWKQEGFTGALKSLFNETDPKLEAQIYRDIDEQIANEKFNPFEIERRGGLIPSNDLHKILDVYGKIFFLKKNFDDIRPLINTLNNLLTHYNMNRAPLFLKRYIRRAVEENIDNITPEGLRKVIAGLMNLTSLRYLAWNIPAGVINTTAGKLDSFINQSMPNFLKGEKRFQYRKGQEIIEKMRVVDTEAYDAIRSIRHGALKVFRTVIFLPMSGYGRIPWGEHYIQGTYYLGQLTNEEFETGKISTDRHRKLLEEIADIHGAYRDNLAPDAKSYAFIKPFLQFKLWMFAKARNRFDRYLSSEGVRKEIREKKYGDHTKAAIKEFTMVLGIASLILANDDDEDKGVRDFFRNLLSDLYAPFDPKKWIYQLGTPAAFLKTAQDILILANYLINNEVYKVNSKYGKKGTPKAIPKALDLLPGRKFWLRFNNENSETKIKVGRVSRRNRDRS